MLKIINTYRKEKCTDNWCPEQVLDISCKRVLGSTERMAIIAQKRHSDLEKRLKLLRQQIYGKAEEKRIEKDVKLENEGENNKSQIPLQYSASNLPNPTSIQTDISYLYHDLVKIGLLASLALGIQLILFFLMKNQIIHLKFPA